MNEHCIECEVEEAEYEDPRSPPIECGYCLCIGCCIEAHLERIDDLEREIEEARSDVEDLKREEKDAQDNTH